MEKYTKKDLINAFSEVGISSGDMIFFHSRLYGLGRPDTGRGRENLCEFFLDAILETIGPEGTLVVPTYTTQVARQDQPFIVEETAPNYGLFPEFVFAHKDFIRSRHPLVSVAATGRLRETVCRSGGASSFGARSPFDVMAKHNAKNVFLGIDLALAITMAHHAEMRYGVPYVYNKILKWRTVENGVPSETSSLASVRYVEYKINYDLKRLKEDLVERGCVRISRAGGGEIQCVDTNDLLETCFDGFQKDPYYLLSQPPDFDYGKIPYDGPTAIREEGQKMENTSGVPDVALFLAPVFSELVADVFAISSPWQRKSLSGMLAGRDEHFFKIAEEISRALVKTVNDLGVPREKIAEYYDMLCKDTQREQMDFRRSGEYRVKDFESAVEDVYGKQEVMEYYLVGILLSQLLWDNHWKLLSFARTYFFSPFCLTSKSHVEIGPGHGWFSNLALQFGAARLDAFDVSEQSVAMTTTLLKAQGHQPEKWSVTLKDVRDGIPMPDNSADTLMAGEVLEHIPDPAAFLKEVNRILTPGGAAYITTAANAPCIDHLYLFKSSDEIRDMLKAESFSIERDIEIVVGKLGDMPLISYGAVLRKM